MNIDGHHILCGKFHVRWDKIERIALEIPANRLSEAVDFLDEQGWTILASTSQHDRKETIYAERAHKWLQISWMTRIIRRLKKRMFRPLAART